METLARLLEKLDWAIAGLLGALVASRWDRQHIIGVRALILFLFTGVACAYYLTRMVSAYLNIDDPQSMAGIGFLLGTFGGSLIAAVLRAIRAADLWALIRDRFGGGA